MKGKPGFTTLKYKGNLVIQNDGPIKGVTLYLVKDGSRLDMRYKINKLWVAGDFDEMSKLSKEQSNKA